MKNQLYMVRKAVRLACVWTPTGDAKRPLACAWQKPVLRAPLPPHLLILKLGGCACAHDKTPTRYTGMPAVGVLVRRTWQKHLLTFLMVFGPGLIVMEADNDAGAVSTYMQAGGQYGMHLLWTWLCCCHLLLCAGDGGPAWHRHRQGPRGDDLRALRQVVGTLLAHRSADRQLSNSGHGICRISLALSALGVGPWIAVPVAASDSF